METIVIFSNNEYLDDDYELNLAIDSKKLYIKKIWDKNQQFLFSYDAFNEVNQDSENVNNAENEGLLEGIIRNIDEGTVYILPHRLPEKSILTTLKEKLQNKRITPDQIIIKKGSNHEDPNTYGLLRKLSGKLDDNTKEGIEKCVEVFEKLKFAIAGNPLLESFIHLHKTLSILQIKGEGTSFNELKNNGDGKYDLAIAKLKEKNNGNNGITEILKWTAEQIPEISKQS